jgi:hypothetical protein
MRICPPLLYFYISILPYIITPPLSESLHLPSRLQYKQQRMRYTTALLSLAAFAAAQDCVTSYETCLATKDEPSCNSGLTQCKDACGKNLGQCNQNGSTSAVCQKNYNTCLNTFPIIPGGSDCVAKFIKCGNSGQSAESCNAQNAVCKDSCTNINSACLSSGSADKAACTKQYNDCYYSTTDTIPFDTVSKYQTCLSTSNNVTSCNAALTNAKDACTTIQATCLVSGTADATFCSSLTAACYYNGSKWTRPSCSSAFNSCTASDSACRATLTSCKDTCTNAEASCRTAQNADVAACSAIRSACDGSANDPIATNGRVNANSTVGGNNATSTSRPPIYTGAASKAGVSAALVGVFGVFACLL